MNIDYTRLIKRLEPEPDGESAVRHRSGLVDAVNADGTVDLDLSGVVIPSVSVLDGAHIGVGDTVQVAAWAGDLLVLGRARQSTAALGQIGYAEVTTTVGSITTSAVNLVTAAFTKPVGRRLKVTGSWSSVFSTVAGDRLNFRIASNAVWMQYVIKVAAGSQAEQGGTITVTLDSDTPTTASMTLQAVRLAGTGTFSVSASAASPIAILVEDIGPI